jgi:hypothetical protein
MSRAHVICLERSPIVDFGVEELLAVLRRSGHDADGPHRLLRTDGLDVPDDILIEIRRVSPTSEVDEFVAAADGLEGPQYRDESFAIERSGERILITSSGDNGLLYGCLELADRVRLGTWLDPELSVTRSPALPIRGVKYNLPWEPYADGEPFEQNEETCFDLEFWVDYLDELARNRYNCLSLWSLHPFHLMVSSPAFRDANPFTDAEIAQHEAFFHALFGHARDRGIEVYLFTWNIYLPPAVATGLGLPRALEAGSEGHPEPGRWERARARQAAPVVTEYYEEMVYRLLITYPELAGIGTSGSEAMAGSGAEKEQWLVDTYLRGIERSGRRVRFLHRTNMQSTGDIDRLAKPRIDPKRLYISWKYSIAHCYSDPLPQFEDLWNAWDEIDLNSTQILFTVRNDDQHTHRWGDVEYVRAYVDGMRSKAYVHGFYWGADGYVWGRDFQHVDHGHKRWRWDFERNRLQFQLWGRLSYDPTTPRAVFEVLAVDDFGADSAEVITGLEQSSRIVPAVNRLAWLDLDFQWHPEGCLTRDSGFRDVLAFVASSPMPGSGTIGIREFVAGGPRPGHEDPESVIEQLRAAAAGADRSADAIEARADAWRAPQANCAVLDLRALAALGRYYALKIGAALALARFADSRDEADRAQAVDLLQQAVPEWQGVGLAWSQHYLPYRMARVARMFGYPYYLEDVRRDVALALSWNP